MRTCLLASLLAVLAAVAPALAGTIDPERRARALELIDRAGAYLASQQHATGGWAIADDPGAPVFPAITGLVVHALALQPGAGDGADAHPPHAQAIDRGVAFMLGHQRADGGIYESLLPSYNTAICVSALTRARHTHPDTERAIERGLDFLRGLQWGEAAGVSESGGGRSPASDTVRVVGPDHPFYGGVGYGRHGRPDNSNLNLVLQAFHDAGVDRDDPVFQRALVFLRRTQMHELVNDAEYARGSRQGGFIYATSETGAEPGVGQSFAGLIEESLDDGTRVSRLRAYGSMTYAGFKSMIYAGLSAEDPRVLLALEWISRNYTLEENPGVGTDGLYYYLLTFARALDAAGIERLGVVGPAGAATPRDWAADLVDRLSGLQREDGSFLPVDDRWMEDNPVLITAYAMLALEHALGLAGTGGR